MSKPRPITDLVKETEYALAKYKAVHAAFPEARCNYYFEFSDKNVNQKYTQYTFEKSYNGLYVIPYCEVPFEYDGKEEIIKVHSQPRRNKLVHLTWATDPTSKKRIMKFARVAINMKNNNFKEEMLNACKAEIMLFVKEHPGYHLDTKHLEPRLKKLLLFT